MSPNNYPPTQKKLKILVQGQVQGVGFRPFVFRLAKELGLTGHVKNSPAGVEICVQGRSDILETFWNRLHSDLPPLARITKSSKQPLEDTPGCTEFRIVHSTSGSGHEVLISPDIATCQDCLQEILDPNNRRYLYPFTNCTNCGPRLTITRSIPYDRESTSMACFPMCTRCAGEYTNPEDRRFHAQPNACAQCGPRLWLEDNKGQRLSRGNKALQEAARLLVQDKILAIKGLGGFHLACQATSEQAIHTLRLRKNRPQKPLAVMVPDLASAQKLVNLDQESAKWLTGTIRPIVLSPKKTKAIQPIPPLLAPDTNCLGLMLPYTPLHVILFEYLKKHLKKNQIPALVMTSGNASSEPIAISNREAKRRLHDIADYFLLHDRDILTRCDDSVLTVLPRTKETIVYRRARGFVPGPVTLWQKGPSVLAAGAEKKSTICLTKGEQAFISQHLGDLKNLETYNFFKSTIEYFTKILQTSPKITITDLHPDYLSTRYAREHGGQIFSLQHHFAHIFSVLAEHKFQGPALGLALDGTGLGTDNTLWGGELLLVNTQTLELKRPGHLAQVRLPGGETAITNPWRIALSFLYALDAPLSDRHPWTNSKAINRSIPIILQMLKKNINSPLTSSCGRLFDAVAAILGLCNQISYEGQAAILLEKIQDPSVDTPYNCPLLREGEELILDTLSLFEQVREDRNRGRRPEAISRSFHLGLINGLAKMAKEASIQSGIRHIALSGGVLQNMTISTLLPAALQQRGLIPLTHRHTPPNDGCISLGQAAYGQLKAILSS